MRPSFFYIFEKSGKNEATDLAVSQLQGSTVPIISAHVPGQHMWASVGPGPSPSSPKQWKSDGRVKIWERAKRPSRSIAAAPEFLLHSGPVDSNGHLGQSNTDNSDQISICSSLFNYVLEQHMEVIDCLGKMTSRVQIQT